MKMDRGAWWTVRQIRSRVRCPCANPESPSIVGVKIAENREPIKPLRAGRFRGFRPFDFFTYRQRGSSAGRAFNFQLEFEKPICGPVALGFACHYGLGLFVPD